MRVLSTFCAIIMAFMLIPARDGLAASAKAKGRASAKKSKSDAVCNRLLGQEMPADLTKALEELAGMAIETTSLLQTSPEAAYALSDMLEERKAALQQKYPDIDIESETRLRVNAKRGEIDREDQALEERNQRQRSDEAKRVDVAPVLEAEIPAADFRQLRVGNRSGGKIAWIDGSKKIRVAKATGDKSGGILMSLQPENIEKNRTWSLSSRGDMLGAVLVGGENVSLRVFDTTNGNVVADFHQKFLESTRDLNIDSHSKRLLAYDVPGDASVWDLRTKRLLYRVVAPQPEEGEYIFHAELYERGERVLTIHRTKEDMSSISEIRLHDVKQKKLIKKVDVYGKKCTMQGNGGRKFLFFKCGESVRVYDKATLDLVISVPIPDGFNIASATVSADLAVFSSRDGRALYYSPSIKSEFVPLVPPSTIRAPNIMSVHENADGTLLAVKICDGHIQNCSAYLYDAFSGIRLAKISERKDDILVKPIDISVEFSPNAKNRFFTTDGTGKIKVFSIDLPD